MEANDSSERIAGVYPDGNRSIWLHEKLLGEIGTVQVAIGEKQGQLSAGELALVPGMVAHSVRNVGTGVARCVGFYAGARVVSTFEQPLMPSGLRVFITDEL
jgi:hypothetical protein